MTTHKRVSDDVLKDVWGKAARAKASSVKTEGNLHATMCHYATDQSLSEDAFMERTKRMEELMQREGKDEAYKKAVRSSSSSVRSVVAAALDQKRTVVRDGKPVGKSRLEQEKKAVINGHKAEVVMDADGSTLQSMASLGDSKAQANDDSDIVMNVRDNLAKFLEGASDDVVADLAFELLHCDPRLTASLGEQLVELEIAA